MSCKTKMFLTATLLVSALCGGLFAQSAPAGSPVAKHGTLSVQGNKIVNKDGDPVALRGMSFFWNKWEGAKFYTTDVTNWLASDWKADIVRVAIDPAERSNSNWKTVVNAAIAQGLYVIIDWHSHNAEGQVNDAKTFFEEQATAYKDKPNVLFEIYNEPIEQTWATVKGYANTIVPAIRAKGANNIIIIGSSDYSKRVDQASKDPVSGTNLAYSVHYYTAEPGRQHQGDLRAWANVALQGGLALFVTEFGVSEADGGQNNNTKIDLEEANTWFEYLDKNSIGWANWSICDKDEAASALRGGASTSGGWNSSNLSPSGTYIRQKLIDYKQTRTVTVTKSGNGTVTTSPGAGPYQYGTMVTLTATADPGWVFETWAGADGASLGKNNPATFPTPLYANKSVQAIFAEGSMITNGTFTSGITGWSFPDGGTLALSDATLKVTVSGTPPANAHVRPGNLTLEHRKKYTVSFRAKAASAGGTITPRVTSTNGNTNYMENPQAVPLTTDWKTTTVAFTMCSPTGAATTTAQLRFDCAAMAGKDWFIDDILMKEDGTGQCDGVAVLPAVVKAQRTAWSIARAGGALQLRGPAESGAKVSLYDTRGKMIRSAAAKDGMSLGVGVPAGNYIVVVKNRAGSEVLRSRVSMVQ